MAITALGAASPGSAPGAPKGEKVAKGTRKVVLVMTGRKRNNPTTDTHGAAGAPTELRSEPAATVTGDIIFRLICTKYYQQS